MQALIYGKLSEFGAAILKRKSLNPKTPF